MSEREKQIMKTFALIIPKLSESDKSYLLGLEEGMAIKVGEKEEIRKLSQTVQEGGETVADVKSEYIVIGSKVETGRPGEADICTRIDGMDISDEELLKVKEVQKQAAEEMEKILNKKPAPGSNRG